MRRIRKQFELVVPEMYRKVKRLEDGEEHDLDAVIEAVTDLRTGHTPDEKLYWRRNKTERSVAVAFLLDMSASTAEAIDETKRGSDDWAAPDDPVEYMVWLRSRRAEGLRRSYKRIIDVEKEGIVLLVNALEGLGDDYGIYGFSGYGRENVEFYVIKDIDEKFSSMIPRRIDRIAPLHATRMGPAIRHATSKLMTQEARSRFMFLISDGRPQDRGYSRGGRGERVRGARHPNGLDGGAPGGCNSVLPDGGQGRARLPENDDAGLQLRGAFRHQSVTAAPAATL